MSAACPHDHERWLVEVLASGPESIDAAARAELERCPHCAEEWAELASVRATLVEAAEEERTAVASAVSAAGAVEERLVREAVAPHLAVRPARLRRAAPWLLAAALAAAVLVFALLRAAPDADEPGVYLSERRIEIATPRGRADWSRFAWKDADPDGAGYRVKVYSESGVELLERSVTASPLVLERSETDPWPDRIYWVVEALDRARRTVPGGSDSAESWR